MRFAPLIIIFTITSTAPAWFAQQRQAPRFEDYRSQLWHGPAAPIKLTTNEQGLFRTRLTEASKEPPNFAGHYRFAIWGCGSNCAASAIVDLQTGNVFAPPHDSKSGAWMTSSGMMEGSGIDFRLESRLVILRAGFHDSESLTNAPDAYYFVLERTRFRQIFFMPGIKSGK